MRPWNLCVILDGTVLFVHRTPKISSADSILAMFRNFSSSSVAIVSRASSGGISVSSTPSASSPQDDTNDADDISLASSHIPSLAPDSPITRPHNTIEIQVNHSSNFTCISL